MAKTVNMTASCKLVAVLSNWTVYW